MYQERKVVSIHSDQVNLIDIYIYIYIYMLVNVDKSFFSSGQD